MVPNPQLREQIRRTAVDPAKRHAESVSRMIVDARRIEQAARKVLEGAGGGVDGHVLERIDAVRRALDGAKQSLNAALSLAQTCERNA